MQPQNTIPKGTLNKLNDQFLNRITPEIHAKILAALKASMRRDEDDFLWLIEQYRLDANVKTGNIKSYWNCSYPTATKALRIVKDEFNYHSRTHTERREIAVKTGNDPELAEISDLSSKDLVRIADQNILRLTEAGDNDAALLKWLDFKTKIQNLRAEEQVLTVDPEKLLGFQGLSAMTEKLCKHLQTIAKHRDMLPTVYEAMCDIVDTARAEDSQ